MAEEALLTGPLEPTNEWYAIAKIAGLKLCQAYRRQYGADFISAMPNNLYGPGDNYHPEHSHVPAGLIRRMHEAGRAGAKAVGYRGELKFDASKPDGVMRKLLDVSRLTALGWAASTPLPEGLALTYADFRARLDAGLIPA